MSEEKKIDEAVEVKEEETDATVEENPTSAESTEDNSSGVEENDSAETENNEDDKKSEKSSKKKKEKKDKKDEQIAELNDKVMRQMAEFENFRKRTEKEKSQMYDMGAKSILEKFLPVIDNFERGLATVPEESKEDAFVVGMENVYKQLMTEMEKVDVKPIEAVGQELNPDLHNAVMQVQTDEFESGVIAQELMKGYTYKDQVIRHSMVGVAE